MAVQNDRLLDAARRVLLDDPAASYVQIAAAAGVSRTTLHARFPSRDALFVALADDAMDRVELAYREARLDEGTCREAVERMVALVLPLGPTVELLLRERSLDDDERITERYERLDDPLIAMLERGRASGELRDDLPSAWLAATLTQVLTAAWEAVAAGDLAANDAPRLVATTVLDGAAPR